MASGAKIGILTGGGDVPGLNSVIKSAVYRASEMGREVIGIRRGWEGLTHLDASQEVDARYIRHLTRESTRAIDRSGGTVLHTSRTNPMRISKNRLPANIPQAELDKLTTDGKTYNFTPIVLRNLERLGIGCLIVIGGDDTLGFAAALAFYLAHRRIVRRGARDLGPGDEMAELGELDEDVGGVGAGLMESAREVERLGDLSLHHPLE